MNHDESHGTISKESPNKQSKNKKPNDFPQTSSNTLPETNGLHLKIDGWIYIYIFPIEINSPFSGANC